MEIYRIESMKYFRSCKIIENPVFGVENFSGRPDANQSRIRRSGRRTNEQSSGQIESANFPDQQAIDPSRNIVKILRAVRREIPGFPVDFRAVPAPESQRYWRPTHWGERRVNTGPREWAGSRGRDGGGGNRGLGGRGKGGTHGRSCPLNLTFY